jgi:hypothetical protein
MADLTQEHTKILSESVFKKLASKNSDLVKEAEDAINEFTRRKMREQRFLRHILPPLNLTNDELDRQVHTAKPIKVIGGWLWVAIANHGPVAVVRLVDDAR